MCAPLSPSDHIAQPEPITMFNLAEAADELHRAALAFSYFADQIANEGATGASLHPRGAQGVLTALRRVEEAFIAWRARHQNMLGDEAATFASETSLADTVGAALTRNAQSILSTAMRRADEIEAADTAGMRTAHARGDALAASLPTYGTTETAPCADLARAAETHDYGKSAAASASYSASAYERGFVSPAVA